MFFSNSFRCARVAGLALALAGGLSACATPQDQAARNLAQAERMMALYGPACTRLGYAAGSDPWRGCVLHLSAQDDLQRYGPYGAYGAVGPWGPYDGWGHGRWRGWMP